jgi:dienelactone hydrolase
MCAKRLINPLDGILARDRATRPVLSLPKNEAEWRAWRSEALARLRDSLGSWPEQVPLEPEEVERYEEDGYTRIKVLYDSDLFSTVPAWLLLPKDLAPGERRPAIVCAHGHGNGKDDVVGVADPSLPVEERERCLKRIERANFDYARQLARRGYVCFAPDWRGFGERQAPTTWAGPDPTRWGSDPCDVLYMAYGYFGFELLALDLWDAMRGVDYLVSRPEVDSARIGCLGLSFGGTMATYLPVLDDRIRVVDVVCYLSTIHDALSPRARGNFCGSQYLRGLLTFGDVSTVAGLIAPRPFLVEIGEFDDCFFVEDALRAYRQVEEVYAAAGAPERLQRDVFPGGHAFGGRVTFEFFDRWLRG